MQHTEKRISLVITLATVAALSAIVFALTRPRNDTKSWKTHAEGILAVPIPCCTEASLWESLDSVRDDGQRPRPANATESARWLNEWPYRSHDDSDAPAESPGIAIRNSEVRCFGTPTGPEVPRAGDDAYTLEAIRLRYECMFIKWRVWNADTPKDRLDERHTVWAEHDGFFRGRIDYWR
jgi:hypothetical protein